MYYINNLLGVVLVIILFLGILWITMKEGNRILAGWARENSFDLLEADYCWFCRGPFWFRSTKAQSVYHIMVRDKDSGETRSGWARCGNWFWGVWGTNAIKVIWEGQSAKEKFSFKPKPKWKSAELLSKAAHHNLT